MFVRKWALPLFITLSLVPLSAHAQEEVKAGDGIGEADMFNEVVNATSLVRLSHLLTSPTASSVDVLLYVDYELDTSATIVCEFFCSGITHTQLTAFGDTMYGPAAQCAAPETGKCPYEEAHMTCLSMLCDYPVFREGTITIPTGGNGVEHFEIHTLARGYKDTNGDGVTDWEPYEYFIARGWVSAGCEINEGADIFIIVD